MDNQAFLFAGQSSQYSAMGKEYYDRYQIFRDTMDEAGEALKRDMKKLCFDTKLDELTKTYNAQPAILTVSYGMYRVLSDITDIKPRYMLGNSLGEYSALVSSGAIKFEDAVKIVKKRGEFMQEAADKKSGVMFAVNAVSAKIVDEICKNNSNSQHIAVISGYNSDTQTVIALHKEIADQVVLELKKKGAVVIQLNVSAPFHSPMMDSARERLAEELSRYTFHRFNNQVIANVDALPYDNPYDIIDRLTRQMTNPVRWLESIHYIRGHGTDTAIEIGPKEILKKQMGYITNEIQSYSMDNISDREILFETYKKKEDRLKFINKCLGIAVSTKNNCLDVEKYQECVVKTYRQLQKLNEEVIDSGKAISLEVLKEHYNLLESILDFKEVTKEDREKHVNILFECTGLEALREQIIS